MPSAANLRNLSATLATAGRDSSGGGADYQAIRSSYLISFASAAKDYLKGGNRTATQKAAERAEVEAFGNAADSVTGGTLDTEQLALLNAAVSQQRKSIDELWDDLKTQKDAGNKQLPAGRLELFARALDALVSQLKLNASPRRLLEFFGSDGVVSCRTCRRLQGAVHTAAWWIAHGLVPGQMGNPNYECGSWRCQHKLRDSKTGEVVTL
jgi:hypothetical protein